MICPYCKAEDQFMTLSTRTREWGMKRVKKCLQCGKNFPTIEIHELTDEAIKSLTVSKKIINKRSK